MKSYTVLDSNKVTRTLGPDGIDFLIKLARTAQDRPQLFSQLVDGIDFEDECNISMMLPGLLMNICTSNPVVQRTLLASPGSSQGPSEPTTGKPRNNKLRAA